MSSEEGRRSLRSADSMTCVVRRAYSNFGHRCFTAVCPTLWNSLLAGLRQTGVTKLAATWFTEEIGHNRTTPELQITFIFSICVPKIMEIA